MIDVTVGEPGLCMYVILKGRVRITAPSGDKIERSAPRLRLTFISKHDFSAYLWTRVPAGDPTSQDLLGSFLCGGRCGRHWGMDADDDPELAGRRQRRPIAL